MITKLKHLSLGVLLIGLTACSSKDNHENNPAVENQAEENTVGSETASEKATVIVPHEKKLIPVFCIRMPFRFMLKRTKYSITEHRVMQ